MIIFVLKGTVRINDNARYPPTVYGYPPKVAEKNEEFLGLNTQSLNNLDLPVHQHVRTRPLDLGAYQNKFQERAKQGFEYWPKDKRIPENNKPKGISIIMKFLSFLKKLSKNKQSFKIEKK